MLKKLAALLLSLLVCLTLLPSQAHAATLPEDDAPPAQVEPVDPDTPDEPEPPVMPLGMEDGDTPGLKDKGGGDPT